jgi:hypothetical protein
MLRRRAVVLHSERLPPAAGAATEDFVLPDPVTDRMDPDPPGSREERRMGAVLKFTEYVHTVLAAEDRAA